MSSRRYRDGLVVYLPTNAAIRIAINENIDLNRGPNHKIDTNMFPSEYRSYTAKDIPHNSPATTKYIPVISLDNERLFLSYLSAVTKTRTPPTIIKKITNPRNVLLIIYHFLE